ncbi:MAG: ATP-dependent Clp protease ATP-binding subunit [Lachnospiraceae bacterium]|nr:ATP-dependent Clp protease ATP-binding subunit [Lachnospiraceae bacterium]
MKIIASDRLDNYSITVLNKAITIANRFKCTEVNTSHMILAIITTIDKLRNHFESSFNVTVEEFQDALKFQCDNGYYGEKTPSYEVTIEDATETVSESLKTVIDNAIKNNKVVEIKELYKELLCVEHSEVYETLQAAGSTKSVDDIEFSEKKRYDSPLKNMPLTRMVGVDMCEIAHNGGYQPVENRDEIVDNIISVLGRKNKGNPVLVGDPGVGKTAIVEGLAQRIESGDVPDFLKDKHIILVDITAITGKSQARGSLEELINRLLNEAETAGNVILFFDEFHMLMEAGGMANGTITVPNILKPALTSSVIKVIGATTYKEYNRYVENDAAFERRIQMIDVCEPSIDTSINILKKCKDSYEKYHNCTIDDSAIISAVKLSEKYIPSRKLPDKAITLIDETAAKLKVKNGSNSFIITDADVQNTISKLTNIDVSQLSDSSKNRMTFINDELHKRIIGQNTAVDSVVSAIKRARAGIKDPNRPVASFLFVGPTGVGKTELAKELARQYTGDVKNLVKFDMSEYMEKFNISRMIGSPPGYVGYGDGGQLTDAVKRNPSAVILFDEIEKAHPDIFNILLQILDDGVLTDAKGTRVSFKNNIIIMTSNAGYKADANEHVVGFVNNTKELSADEKEANAIKALEGTFRPEMLNRIDKVVVFNSLSKDDCVAIIKNEIEKLSKRLNDKGIKLTYDNSVVTYVNDNGYSEKYGARNIKRFIQTAIEDKLADYVIDNNINKDVNIKITCVDNTIVIKSEAISDNTDDVIVNMCADNRQPKFNQ